MAAQALQSKMEVNSSLIGAFMNSSHTQQQQASAAYLLIPEGTVRWAEEHDVALGCESADPALQIERWCAEAQPKTDN